MPGGKAHGPNRQYQLDCRDILISRNPEQKPWVGDGIDVPFKLFETTWSVDVALRTPEDFLVVAECRRQVDPVKQRDVAGFAHTVERLRESLGIPVAGVFIAKRNHQAGAIRVGEYEGIEVVILDEGSVPASFNITFLRYDFERKKKLHHITMHVPPGSFTITGHDAELTHRNAAGEVIAPDRSPPAE